MSPLVSNVRSAYVVSGAFVSLTEAETVVDRVLAPLREAFERRPRALERVTAHGERYSRQLLDGSRPIHLATFLRFLFASYLPESPLASQQREFVRRILDHIARPFGLTVVETAARPTADVRTEVLEANEACSRAFIAVHDAMADRRIDDDERAEIQQRVLAAQRELNDLIEAVR